MEIFKLVSQCSRLYENLYFSHFSVFGARKMNCFLCYSVATVVFYVAFETPAARATLISSEI